MSVFFVESRKELIRWKGWALGNGRAGYHGYGTITIYAGFEDDVSISVKNDRYSFSIFCWFSDFLSPCFEQKRRGYYDRLLPSVMLSPLKLLYGIQPNLVYGLLTCVGRARAPFILGPAPRGKGSKSQISIRIQFDEAWSYGISNWKG